MRHHPTGACVSRRASRAFIPAAKPRSTARWMPSGRSTPGADTTPPFRPSARALRLRVSVPPPCSLGLPPEPRLRRAYDAAADFCGAVREDSAARRPGQDTPPIARGQLPDRRCLDAGFITHAPAVDGGLGGGVPSLLSVPHLVSGRVPRPAPAFHAAFRPHLAVTPWRFPGPPAPRIPGRGTCTPKHDNMPGTHARQ